MSIRDKCPVGISQQEWEEACDQDEKGEFWGATAPVGDSKKSYVLIYFPTSRNYMEDEVRKYGFHSYTNQIVMYVLSQDYHCYLCGKDLTSKQNLVNHHKIHTGFKVYFSNRNFTHITFFKLYY